MVMYRITHASVRKSQTNDQGVLMCRNYNSDYPKVITNDVSTKGLGATLWKEQLDGKLESIGFANRF